MVSKSGAIGYATDTNYYQFSVSTTGQVVVETYAQQLGSSLDTRLTLLDATGKVITTNDDSMGTDSKIVITLAPGTYYAQVQSSDNTLGYYAVHFTALASPAPQIVGITPGQTIGVSPNPLVVQLSVDNGAIDPATITPAAFNLTILGPGDTPLPGVSGQISATSYDPTTNTISVTIVALDSSSQQPLANLPSGIYVLTARGWARMQSPARRASALAGGNYTGNFAVVAQPPTATLGVTGIAGGNSQGVLFQFSGSISQVFPANGGSPVRIDLDTEGNGLFQDGRSRSTQFEQPVLHDRSHDTDRSRSILDGGLGPLHRRRRKRHDRHDHRANRSAASDRNQTAGGNVNVSFSMPVSSLQNVLDPASYQLAGANPSQVVLDTSDPSGRTVTLVPATPLADGKYSSSSAARS